MGAPLTLECGQGGLSFHSLTVLKSGGACIRDTPKIPPCSVAAWLQTGSSQVELGTSSLLQGALLAFWTSSLLWVGDSCVSNKTGEAN